MSVLTQLECVDNSNKTVKNIHQYKDEAQCLIDSARAKAKAGKINEAKTNLDSAVNLFTYDVRRLVLIASAQAEADLKNDSKVTFSRAVELITPEKYGQYYVRDELGNPNKLETLHEFVQTTYMNAFLDLHFIAHAQAEAGFPTEAKVVFDKANKIASGFVTGIDRNTLYPLKSLTIPYNPRMNLIPSSSMLINAEGIFSFCNSWTLQAIASAFAKAGLLNEAKVAFTQASENLPGNNFISLQYLRHIALSQVSFGFLDDAKKTFNFIVEHTKDTAFLKEIALDQTQAASH